MSTAATAYALFNYAEAITWAGAAAWMWFRLAPRFPERRRVLARAALGLLAFGCTDVAEAPTFGQLPWWVWLAKAICFVFLLKCRKDWLGPAFSWKDRFFKVGLVVAILALVAVALQVFVHWAEGR